MHNPQGRGLGVERVEVGVEVGKFLPLTFKGRDLMYTIISSSMLDRCTIGIESMNN